MTYEDKARGGRRPRTPLPDPDQMTLSRGEQLQLLRDLELPTEKGQVKSVILKAVLRTIDDHMGRNNQAWPSQPTICLESGTGSVRQVQRALKVLKDRSLVMSRPTCQPGSGRGGGVNHYSIVWNEIKLLVARQDEERRASHCDLDTAENTAAILNDPSASTVVRVVDAARATRTTITTDPSTNLVDPSASRGVLTAHLEPSKNRPPPENAFLQLAPDWAEVAKDFVGKQTAVAELAAEHEAKGFTARQFRERMTEAWAIADLPENDGKFETPGAAVAWYLRNGAWPRANVVTLELAQKQRAERQTRAAAATADEMRDQMLRVAAANREAVYGPLLDSLDETDLLQLIERCPKLAGEFFVRYLPQRPLHSIVREKLLQLLADEFS